MKVVGRLNRAEAANNELQQQQQQQEEQQHQANAFTFLAAHEQELKELRYKQDSLGRFAAGLREELQQTRGELAEVRKELAAGKAKPANKPKSKPKTEQQQQQEEQPKNDE